LQCDRCEKVECFEGKDCLNMQEEVIESYTGQDRLIHHAAALIEGEYYMQKTRVEELILFCREMGYERLGVAFCIGLREEAKVLCSYLRKHFRIYSVCCKICGTSKDYLALPKIKEDEPEVMCNPIIQARTLRDNKSEINVTVGLCIGHDILFNQHSNVPTTALIVKDRVLSHNPAGALYTGYYKRLIGG